jgi:acyl-[acyl-carrier-protein] desaturase
MHDAMARAVRGESRETRRMTHQAHVPSDILLRELLPSVQRALDRHVAVASSWSPHEFVPYEEGRNFESEPWQPADSSLPDVAQMALEVNLLTEDNLPYYHLSIWRAFGDDGAWGDWVRRWTAEEGRHAIALREFLTVTRGLDPVRLEAGRMDMALRGWYPRFAEEGPLDGVVYTTIQELATRLAHRNTGEITGDAAVKRICARIATDENLHYVFYRDLAAEALRVDPSAAMAAIRRQVTEFAMPGAGMPGFHRKAKAMASAGIYNVRIHLEQVLRPVLEKHWCLDRVEGLSDEAERARDAIYDHLARLERIARKLEEPLGPVAGDDPITDP